jgi:hypothetical protein
VFDFLTRTIESPCRKCENIDMNKEECSDDCARLREFQNAILFYEESNIKEFGIRSFYS